MPPWPPGKRSPAYVGQSDRRLSAPQRAAILAWARAEEGRRPRAAAADSDASRPAPGETLLDLRMPTAYRPSAPKGVTDDYRCFLLDPSRAADGFVTSAGSSRARRRSCTT